MQETASSTIGRVRRTADRLGKEIPGTQIYLFGSALIKSNMPADIDILIVYPSGEFAKMHELANALRNLDTFLPLDVLVLDDGEEQETNFLKEVPAKLIWSSAH